MCAEKKKKAIYKVAYYDEKGKRRGKTFTASTEPKARKKGERWKKAYDANKKPAMTVLDAVEGYLTVKESVLSPTTVRSYKSIEKNHLGEIENISLLDITKADVQKWISDLVSSGASPKTVRNCFGLVQAAALMYDDELKFKVQLPQPKPYKGYCPSDDDVMALINAIKEKDDTTMLIGILLIAFGPLREGEACALTSEDVNGNVISINKSMAYTVDHEWVIKQPKTTSSVRDIEYPDFVIDLVKNIDGRLVPLTPHAFYDRFRRIIKSIDIPYFRVHDLRHYGASIMHSLNIPDVYLLQRGGWASDYTMKRVYRNSIKTEQIRHTQTMMAHFKKFG